MKKKYYVTFSGGKDSLDALIWAQNNLSDDEWEVVFCDTGWEAKITYDYVDELEQKIGKKFIRLRTTHFDDRIDRELLQSIYQIFGEHNVFAMLVAGKSRFPSTRARFCTEFLKMRVMIDFVLGLDHDCVIIQGVRNDESLARRMLKREDEYFKFYFEPKKHDAKGRPVYDNYRSEEVHRWCDTHTCDVLRPIIHKTAEEVFQSIYEHGYKPNPLYLKGHSRVGCFPCIMCRLQEVRLVALNEPERIEKIAALEELLDTTFFPPEYIPQKFCTKLCDVRVYREDLPRVFKSRGAKSGSSDGGMFGATEAVGQEELLYQQWFASGRVPVYQDEEGEDYILRKMRVPTVRDVVRYVTKGEQSELKDFLNPSGCVSVYNICEAN